MDNFIRRLRSLLFLSTISGIFTVYVILSFLDLQSDFNRIQRLFFALILISDSYEAKIDPTDLPLDFLRDDSEEEWNRVKSSKPPASSYMGETENLFDARIVLENGLTYDMRVLASAFVSKNEMDLIDLLAPDDENSDDAENNDYAFSAEALCPSFDADTGFTYSDEFNLTCFEVSRDGQNIEREYIWIADGREWDFGEDVAKWDGLYFVDVDSIDQQLSVNEVKSKLISLSERYFVGTGNEESHYLNVRDAYFNQEFQMPIANIKTSFNEYFRYYVYINLVLSIFILHASVGIFQRSNIKYPNEPWIMLTKKSYSNFHSTIGYFLNTCGCVSTLFSILLPSAATIFYIITFEMGSIDHKIVVTSLCVILQSIAIIYVLAGVYRLNSLDPRAGLY